MFSSIRFLFKTKFISFFYFKVNNADENWCTQIFT